MRKLLLVLVAAAASLGLMAGPAAARDRGHDKDRSGHEESGHDASEWGRGRSDDQRAEREARAEQKASRKAEKSAEQHAEREARQAGKEAAKEAAKQERQATEAATMVTKAQPEAEANGSLTIVHAIPNVAVDIYIDGAVVAPNVAFGTTQTLELAPATILVEVRGAGAPATDPPLLEQTFRIKPNVAKSFVAYLNADGEPEDDVFYDNVIQNQQKAQLTVRHLAAAPAVDVYVDGDLTFEGLTNPHQAKAFLDAGTYTVQITAAGDPATVVLPDTQVTLDARTNTIVSASGDLAAGTFSTVTQVLPMDVVATGSAHAT
jgi:hypothetical protein